MSDQQTKPDLLENLGLMIRDCNESLEDEGSGYTEDQRQSVTLLRDVARLAETALNELARIASTARANGPIMCVHCREVVAGDMDDPELEAHMAACEKHPMRAVEARVKELEAELDEYRCREEDKRYEAQVRDTGGDS